MAVRERHALSPHLGLPRRDARLTGDSVPWVRVISRGSRTGHRRGPRAGSRQQGHCTYAGASPVPTLRKVPSRHERGRRQLRWRNQWARVSGEERRGCDHPDVAIGISEAACVAHGFCPGSVRNWAPAPCVRATSSSTSISVDAARVSAHSLCPRLATSCPATTQPNRRLGPALAALRRSARTATAPVSTAAES